MTGLFQVATQYSNAVLLAILPYVNDAAKSLGLSVPRPITTNHIQQFRCDPREGHFGGVLFLTNACTFWFEDGHVSAFESAHCYYGLQDPNQIPRFYGKVRLNQKEAVQIARQAIFKLGHDVARIRNEEPDVAPLERIGNNVVPHYKITWPYVFPGGARGIFARVEVNGKNGAVEEFSLPAKEFSRSPPTIAVTRPPAPKRTNAPSGGIPLTLVSAERQSEILKTVLPEMSAYAQRLKLPAPAEIKTNHLKDIQCGLLNGGPHVQVILANGYRLSYTWGYVSSFYAPDCFFTYDWKEHGKTASDFTGPLPSRLEPLEELARNALKATGQFKAARFLDEKPIFAGGPDLTNKVDITRFLFYWELPGRLTEKEKEEIPPELWPTAIVEVDSKTMRVQSVFIHDPKR